jgi:transcriptional regulator
MKRRDLLAGVAYAAAAAAKDNETLYIPQPHHVVDRALLHDFMDEHAFVDLVTAKPSIRITHIPVLLDRTKGTYGTLYGHIAKKNPQRSTFTGRQSAVIVFRGPHSYISPSWYANQQAVPTWNFGVVHASGKLKPITDPKALYDLLTRLVGKFEPEGRYQLTKLPESFTSGMIGGIIGFEMEIEALEGKFKLGQERSEADRAGILAHLQGEMREFTEEWYRKFKKL